MFKALLFTLFFVFISSAQTITCTVTDNANKPLEAANVIAIPYKKPFMLNKS